MAIPSVVESSDTAAAGEIRDLSPLKGAVDELDLLIEQVEIAIDAPVEPAVEAALSALYRLAELRAACAFVPACRLLRDHDADACGSLFETAITEVVPWILASTFDGDVETLLDGILDIDGDQFVRSAMLRALVLLVHDGRLDRSVAERAVAALPQTSPDIEQDCLWRVWFQAVAALQLHELVPLVERTLEGLGSQDTLEALDTFKTEYAKTADDPMYLFAAARSDFRSFATADEARARVEDVNESMWQFRDIMTAILRARAERPDAALRVVRRALHGDELGIRLPPLQVFNDKRGIGRNDPCPCGSGLKYKKCCLD